MLNFDPTKPLPQGEYEWNDPKLKYIPPAGIGANPVIYFNNLLMLVLECNCPPSPRGLYHSVSIAKEWIPWLKAHPAFELLAHIQHVHNDLTGEEQYILWRLQDWKESSAAQEAQQEIYAQNTKDFWSLRYRTYRAVHHLYDVCDTGWEMAKSMVKDWARYYFMPNMSEDIRTLYRGMLETVHFFDSIEDSEVEEFKLAWRTKGGHVYDGPHDLTGLKPED